MNLLPWVWFCFCALEVFGFCIFLYFLASDVLLSGLCLSRRLWNPFFYLLWIPDHNSVTSGLKSSCTGCLNPIGNLHSQLWLWEALPIHCMMTMQFTKLQASWNPALKKPQTLPELLINYWWRPDKCTWRTIPMTFFSPALGHFCSSLCLYVCIRWYKSYKDGRSAHLNHKR